MATPGGRVGKNRLPAFSDGVIAIIIMAPLGAVFLSYVLSFIVL